MIYFDMRVITTMGGAAPTSLDGLSRRDNPTIALCAHTDDLTHLILSFNVLLSVAIVTSLF